MSSITQSYIHIKEEPPDPDIVSGPEGSDGVLRPTYGQPKNITTAGRSSGLGRAGEGLRGVTGVGDEAAAVLADAGAEDRVVRELAPLAAAAQVVDVQHHEAGRRRVAVVRATAVGQGLGIGPLGGRRRHRVGGQRLQRSDHIQKQQVPQAHRKLLCLCLARVRYILV
ncbi:MAG: hypothetical protein AB202_00010 [Parcubacteria bacterium C7867-007]|nr:MAG: hypothetical protein AB202_00010 [Parcubacteria bacterium C7867-007]